MFCFHGKIFPHSQQFQLSYIMNSLICSAIHAYVTEVLLVEVLKKENREEEEEKKKIWDNVQRNSHLAEVNIARFFFGGTQCRL